MLSASNPISVVTMISNEMKSMENHGGEKVILEYGSMVIRIVNRTGLLALSASKMITHN